MICIHTFYDMLVSLKKKSTTKRQRQKVVVSCHVKEEGEVNLTHMLLITTNYNLYCMHKLRRPSGNMYKIFLLIFCTT